MSGESVADLYWVLTTAKEVRARAPHRVGLGIAGAALCDLKGSGEVSWQVREGVDGLAVRSECSCVDAVERTWHDAIADYATGGFVPVRFCLDPLIPVAWRDVAERLTAAGVAEMRRPLLRVGRPRFRLTDPAGVEVLRAEFAAALRGGRLDLVQRCVVAAAWATESFDDLFRPHGVEADRVLAKAAEQIVADDPLTRRLSAAQAFSNGALPGGPVAG